jgi:pimeloyl-ACP methyl ester carboxylesterase
VIEELRLNANGLRFRALAAAGRRAVAPDLRGYGGTDAPEGVEQYLMGPLLDDVEGLLDVLGAERVDLVGHDWGAIIGWQFTSQRQHRVRTWSALSVGHPHALAEIMREGDQDQRDRSAYIALFNQPGKAETVLLEDGARRLRALYNGVFPPEVEDRFLKDLQRPGRLTAALNYYRANLTADRLRSYQPAPHEIVAPTLLVWGEEDAALGRLQAERTARHVRGPYQFAALPRTGHWLQHERPEEVSRLLVQHVSAE